MSEQKSWDGRERRSIQSHNAQSPDQRTVTLHAVPPDADELLRQLKKMGLQDLKIEAGGDPLRVRISYSRLRHCSIAADALVEALREAVAFEKRADAEASDLDTDRLKAQKESAP